MKDISSDLFVGNVTLTNCDRELVHIANAIQPHALLLVVQKSNLKILQASENAESFFKTKIHNLLNAPIEKFLKDEQCKKIKDFIKSEQSQNQPYALFRVSLGDHGFGTEYTCYIHSQERIVTLEFLPAINSTPLHSNDYEEAAIIIFTFLSIDEILNYSLKVIMQHTDFDRVLAYQFDRDGAGFVSSEIKKPQSASYLGHHFPSTDIPQPSRRILQENVIRLIPNMSYEKVNLVPTLNPLTNTHLDMTYIGGRHVSIMCSDYFKNMGVQSSLVLPIVVNGSLWGILSGHHSKPKYLSQSAKDFCSYVGQLTSLAISKVLAHEETEYLYQVRDHVKNLDKMIAQSQNFFEGLRKTLPELKSVFESSAIALIGESEVCVHGEDIPQDALNILKEWLDHNLSPDQSVFMFNNLSAHKSELIAIKNAASGCLGFALGGAGKGYLIWFRGEKIREIKWAGPPEKPRLKNSQNLSPRKSFETWRESVKNTCHPWLQNEIKAAIDIKNSFTDILLDYYKKLSKLTVRLKKSNEDLESFAYVASHDLKEPLRGIHNYANYLINEHSHELSPEVSTKLTRMGELTKKMDSMVNAVLKFSQLDNLHEAKQLINPQTAITAALDHLKHLTEKQNVKITIAKDFPDIKCYPHQLEEIFLNLISNAIHYNDKPVKKIEIGYQLKYFHSTDIPVFFVRDNGIGVPKNQFESIFKIFKRLQVQSLYENGTGVGLSIVKKYIESHDGKIWLKSEIGKGTTFYFTLTDTEENNA